jgi:predicted phosphoribosyltransferase
MQSVLFQNRVDAGQKLANRMARLKQRNESIVIVAIPRGGVIIGDVIATELGAGLDIVVSRKIGAPDNPEFAVGALMPDGSYFLNREHVKMLNISAEYIRKERRRLKSFSTKLKPELFM